MATESSRLLSQGEITTLSYSPHPPRVSTPPVDCNPGVFIFTNSKSNVGKSKINAKNNKNNINNGKKVLSFFEDQTINCCNKAEECTTLALTKPDPSTINLGFFCSNSTSVQHHPYPIYQLISDNTPFTPSPPASPLTPESSVSSSPSSSSLAANDDIGFSESDTTDDTTDGNWESLTPSLLIAPPCDSFVPDSIGSFRSSTSSNSTSFELCSDSYQLPHSNFVCHTRTNDCCSSSTSSSHSQEFSHHNGYCEPMESMASHDDVMYVDNKQISFVADLNSQDINNNHNHNIHDFIKIEDVSCYKQQLTGFNTIFDREVDDPKLTQLNPVGHYETAPSSGIDFFPSIYNVFPHPNSPVSNSDYEQNDYNYNPTESDDSLDHNNPTIENGYANLSSSDQQSPDSSSGLENNLPVFHEIELESNEDRKTTTSHQKPLDKPTPYRRNFKKRHSANSSPKSPERERRKPGRKPGQISNVLHLWEFMRDLLFNPDTNRKIVEWVSQADGVFKVNNSAEVARLWGLKKNNKKEMTYEKLSRSLRYSRDEGYFDNLPKDKNYPKKLCFKFGPKSKDWARPYLY